MREYLLGLITTPAAAAVLFGLVWLDPQLRRCGFKDRRLVYFGGAGKYLFGGRVHFHLHHRDFIRAWTRLSEQEGTYGRTLRRMRTEHPDLLPPHMRRLPVPTLDPNWMKKEADTDD